MRDQMSYPNIRDMPSMPRHTAHKRATEITQLHVLKLRSNNQGKNGNWTIFSGPIPGSKQNLRFPCKAKGELSPTGSRKTRISTHRGDNSTQVLKPSKKFLRFLEYALIPAHSTQSSSSATGTNNTCTYPAPGTTNTWCYRVVGYGKKSLITIRAGEPNLNSATHHAQS
jgi:hypothetical protein